MQTQCSLSQDQERVLQGVFAFTKAVTVYLESHLPCITNETDQRHVENLLNFGVLNLSRLVSFFHEIEAWEKRGRR